MDLSLLSFTDDGKSRGTLRAWEETENGKQTEEMKRSRKRSEKSLFMPGYGQALSISSGLEGICDICFPSIYRFMNLTPAYSRSHRASWVGVAEENRSNTDCLVH